MKLHCCITEVNEQAQHKLLSLTDAEQLLSILPGAVSIKTTAGIYLSCNTAFLELLKLKNKESVIGNTDSNLPWASHADIIRRLEHEIFFTGLPKTINETLRFSNGDTRHLLTKKLVITNNNACITHLLSMIFDITAKKNIAAEESGIHARLHTLQQQNTELHKEVKQLKNLLNNLPGSLYWKDKNGVYLGNNAYAKSVLQSLNFTDANTSVAGKTDFDLFEEKTAQLYRKHDLEVMSTASPICREEEYIGTDGNKQVNLSHKKPFFDEEGNIIGVIGNTVNITELKQVQAELAKTVAAYEATNEIKSEILRNLSHDIRTPLGGIIGMSTVLMNEHPILCDDLIDIKNSAEQLLNFINNVFLVAELESGQDHVPTDEPIVLHDTVHEVIELFKPSIRNKNLHCVLHFDETIPRQVKGKREYVYRILMNLLANALKFTPTGTVSITVERLRTENGKILLQLTVSDTGIGIPFEKQHSIFEPFTRINPSYKAQHAGSGLGLYLVKELLSKLNGEICVKSRPNEGSHFTCTFSVNSIPIDKNGRSNVRRKHSPTLPQEQQFDFGGILKCQPHILLVEDNPLVRKVTARNMRRWGCSITIATTGEEALLLASKQHYQLILMDLGLPKKDGCAIAAALHTEKEQLNYATIIIALTAHADEITRAQCASSGLPMVVNKPLTVEKVKLFLSQYCTPVEEIIDLQQGGKILNADVNAALEMLHLLAKQLPNDQPDLASAFYKRDYKTLRNCLHQLQGALSYCGVPQMLKATKQLQHALLDNDESLINQYYIALMQTIERFYIEYTHSWPRCT